MISPLSCFPLSSLHSLSMHSPLLYMLPVSLPRLSFLQASHAHSCCAIWRDWTHFFSPHFSFHLCAHLVGAQMASFCVARWSKSSVPSPWTRVKSAPSVKVTISARVANLLPSQTVPVWVCARVYVCMCEVGDSG